MAWGNQPVYSPQPQPNDKAKPNSTVIIITVILGLALVVGGLFSVCTNKSKTNSSQQTSSYPAITTEERSYATKMSANAKGVSSALNNLIGSAQSPAIGNATWEATINSQISILQAYIQEGRAITPPASLSNAHSEYIQFINHIDNACQYLKTGLKTYDSDLINQATAEINLAAPHGQEAKRLIEEFNLSRGIK
ncbi:hypothetical protein M0R72_12950 [Candidatus Pacearchaeota archaeon]|jgi:hypothetical protein|nr:hypothetical protein [Candidatus Pacearchaeota archaeon]